MHEFITYIAYIHIAQALVLIQAPNWVDLVYNSQKLLGSKKRKVPIQKRAIFLH